MKGKPLAYDPIAEAQRQWREHGWGEVAGGMSAVTSIVRAQQIVISRVEEVLKPHELTFARYELLTLLFFSQTGSLPLARIGTLLQVHPASVTNAVDRCEARGLVRRERHPTDRRTTLARLTDEGRKRVANATAALNDAVFADVGLSEADVESLVAVLGRFREAHGDF